MSPADHVQLSAFLDGFAQGADERRRSRRHVVEPATHAEWKRGFEAGRDAARLAMERWKQALERAR